MDKWEEIVTKDVLVKILLRILPITWTPHNIYRYIDRYGGNFFNKYTNLDITYIGYGKYSIWHKYID